jgi:DNA-binding transcriptional regulator LsrR (DeoR family)
VELYRKVRLARSEGMNQRELARHFNISRDSVRKMLAFLTPPGCRQTKAIKRMKLDRFAKIIDG